MPYDHLTKVKDLDDSGIKENRILNPMLQLILKYSSAYSVINDDAILRTFSAFEEKVDATDGMKDD